MYIAGSNSIHSAVSRTLREKHHVTRQIQQSSWKSALFLENDLCRLEMLSIIHWSRIERYKIGY